MLTYIKQTWTWNHKLLIVTIALLVANVYQSGIVEIPTLQAEEIRYERPVQEDHSLEAQLERRAIELHEQNKAIDLEHYRQEAIREMNVQLLEMSSESPFVDYQELKDKYGY